MTDNGLFEALRQRIRESVEGAAHVYRHYGWGDPALTCHLHVIWALTEVILKCYPDNSLEKFYAQTWHGFADRLGSKATAESAFDFRTMESDRP